jgi:hypothetical protein
MSADQLLYQMDQSGHSSDWFDFDNTFEFQSGYLDCDPNAVNSISPEHYDLPFPDLDANWDPPADSYSQPLFPDMGNYEASIEDAFQSTAETFGPLDPTSMLDHTLPPDPALFDPTFSYDPFYNAQGNDQVTDWTSSVRHLVETQAAADPSCLSTKAKRRDASIAIHLQRLHNPPADGEISSDSNPSLSPWSDFVRESDSATTAQVGSSITPAISTDDSTSASPDPEAAGRGVELVLDLNMNATANLPKKQKPRSQAQKENYIKARKHGACEKHRKQHKRVCTVFPAYS